MRRSRSNRRLRADILYSGQLMESLGLGEINNALPAPVLVEKNLLIVGSSGRVAGQNIGNLEEIKGNRLLFRDQH